MVRYGLVQRQIVKESKIGRVFNPQGNVSSSSDTHRFQSIGEEYGWKFVEYKRLNIGSSSE
jgi:hypothetical protein